MVPDYLCCGLKLAVTKDEVHKNHEPSTRSGVVQHDQSQRRYRLPNVTGQQSLRLFSLRTLVRAGPRSRRAALALVGRHTSEYTWMYVESIRSVEVLADSNTVLEPSPLIAQIKESSPPCMAGSLNGPQVSRFISLSRSTFAGHAPARWRVQVIPPALVRHEPSRHDRAKMLRNHAWGSRWLCSVKRNSQRLQQYNMCQSTAMHVLLQT